MQGRAQHFPSNLYPYPNHNHQHRSMPTHAIQIAPVYQKLCLPTYTRSWLDQTHKRSFIVIGFSPKRFLVSVFPTSKKFDSDLELDARMYKTDAHPCPHMNNNITPMPIQNPKPMGMGMGTQCRALIQGGCNFYMALNGSCVHGHLECFRKPPLRGRPDTKHECEEYST
jgi:hypothetical protein